MERHMLIAKYGKPGQHLTNGSVINMYKDAMKKGLGANLSAEWMKMWTDRPDVCTKTLRVKMMRVTAKASKLRRGALATFMADTFILPVKQSLEEMDSPILEPASLSTLTIDVEIEPSTTTSVQAPFSTPTLQSELSPLISTAFISTTVSETEPSSSSGQDMTPSKSPLKRLNAIRHGISINEKRLTSLKDKVVKEREELLAMHQMKGHFSLKNVKKREERNILMKRKLRAENSKLKEQLKEQEKELRGLKEQLLQLEAMRKKSLKQERKIRELQKGKRRAEKRASFHQKDKAKLLKEVREREEAGKVQIEEGMRQIVTVQDGKYNEKMRMCVMELAALEVATGKMGEVIKSVCGKICGANCSHVPSRQACQNIIDEGQFIVKRMLGEKLKDCRAWGLHKDGTSRKTIKILDTSVQTDDGSSLCLGFSSVVSETGEAIAEEAKQKIGEVSEAVGEERIGKELLMKMTYFMNDRAGNEKKSSRLLEQWREQALREEGEQKASEIFHLFCSAHVLLGFHSYTLKQLSDFSTDQVKHPISLLLRDASDLFGPVGDYRGLRNVWLAHCHESNQNSFIQNYKDNRFNGLFEVSAQVFFHHENFSQILESRTSTNNKQTRLLKALRDQNLMAILECLGLFFFKITGPFWTLVTSLNVKFSSLPEIIQSLEKGLAETTKNPSLLFLDHTFGLKKLKSKSIMMQHKFATNIKNPFMAQIIVKICFAFLDTIHSQLSDYLHDGKFGKKQGLKKLERASFAPLTNLVSERNFGLLDASQKRRPSASLHHHTSVIMLKQNRERLGRYVSSLPSGTRKLMWARAMVMGRTLRKRHRDQDKGVLLGSIPVASTSKGLSSRKRKALPEEPCIQSMENVKEGEMIAVACEDGWYPGLSVTPQNADANALFEKYTIEEIRNLEKKTRSDIEKKKEDLRVMVGERYRDLIDAADTITDMKGSAENVMKSISRMEELCTSMRQNHMVRGASFHDNVKKDSNKSSREMDFYGTAAQIKLLMDIPEQIWSSVESQDYLRATRLFLLARHINTSLHIDSRRSSDMLTWFPVLTRQWAAISHFKTTMLQGCRTLLTDTEVDLSDQQMAEVLCSIILLEDSTPRQVFTEFLLARTKAVQQILHSGMQSNVKVQVTSVARLLVSSVRQIFSIFYYHNTDDHRMSPSSGLLLATLENVISSSQEDGLLSDLQGTISLKCLPAAIKNFRPVLRTAATPIPSQNLRDNCQQWIHTCLQDVQAGVGKLLNFVNSVKRLADIRDELWTLLSQLQGEVNWKQITENVVSLNVWEDFLRPLFVDRVKALVQYQLDTTAELTKRTVSKVMMELTSDMNDRSMQCERNLAAFVWTEAPSDMVMSDIWQPAANKTLMDSGGLILKARSFTPAVQSLCRSIDEKLKGLLEDTETYVEKSDTCSGEKDSAFQRFADTNEILKYIQGSCMKCVQEILDYLTEQLRLWEKSLADIPDPVTNAITENKVLLTARTCAAMRDMTPHLQRCILAPADWNKQATFKLTKKLRSQKPFDLPEWQSVHSKLDQCQMSAYRIWVNYTSKQHIGSVSDIICSPLHPVILSQTTRWEEVEIVEESEEGTKLSSKICVPMQASWHIQTLLYKICDDLNKIGIQSLPRSVVRDLIILITDGIVAAYEHLLATRGKGQASRRLTQHEVLQELFNFRFIQAVIPRKEEAEVHRKYNKRCQHVIESLEEMVDPFDLDVFTPYIQANLSKQAQRDSVIFGVLLCLDKHGISSSSCPVLSSQEQHNVVPLSSCPHRFPLLPLGSQHNSRPAFTTQPFSSQAIPRAPESSGQSLTSQVEATLPMTSSQTDLSSSFYDKMEKLGSMGSRIFSNISGKS